MIMYGPTDSVEPGESNTIKDIGAEITHRTKVPALKMVRRINSIFMAKI
ncbi:hypothetical protein [Lacihabitans sp. LS3-19]|nr:hypothetical protein [Lacihabitans sp. LS3-19]